MSKGHEEARAFMGIGCDARTLPNSMPAMLKALFKDLPPPYAVGWTQKEKAKWIEGLEFCLDWCIETTPVSEEGGEREALQEVYDCLGPKACASTECVGCACEIELALKAVRPFVTRHYEASEKKTITGDEQ